MAKLSKTTIYLRLISGFNVLIQHPDFGICTIHKSRAGEDYIVRRYDTNAIVFILKLSEAVSLGVLYSI